jgi:hypothetical protein
MRLSNPKSSSPNPPTKADDSLHTAIVIEIFRDDVDGRVGPTLTFRQEHWVSERTPYGIGQEMVVFLLATKQGYERLAGEDRRP